MDYSQLNILKIHEFILIINRWINNLSGEGETEGRRENAGNTSLWMEAN